MQLQLQPNAGVAIRSVDDGGLRIGDAHYPGSILLSHDRILGEWPIQSVEQLGETEARALVDLGPELVIVGTGKQLIFGPPRFSYTLLQRGIGVEFMDTAAACRTFNVVVAEGRRVVAGIIQ